MRRGTSRWRPRRAGPARPASRGVLRVAAVAVIVAAAGVTAGSAPAAGEQAVSLTLGYSCSFPSGPRPVSARITATFPAAATAGKPIEPTGTGITVTLPRAAIAGLARLHTAAVGLTAGLVTAVTEGPRSATVAWRGFRSPAAAIPRTGSLTLTASGQAPALTAAAAGAVTVSAAGLSLLFTARAAGINPAGPPGPPASRFSPPATPSGLRVACLPRAGQDATLARIAVARPAPARSQASAAAKIVYCPDFPYKLKLNPIFPLPKPPKGSRATHDVTNACSNATGFTNAARLHEAVLVGPGLTNLRLGVTTYAHFPVKGAEYTYIQVRAAGQLEYDGLPELPPARGTLLAFGFMPVSATLQISEIGSLNAALISCAPLSKKYKCPNHPVNVAYFFGLVSLHIYDVDINGVPLNVGAHCQTATPFDLELVGLPPSYNVSETHGVLTGTVTVPSFTGCANGPDDLDPIFDATVSGPGNFAKINQGVLCTPNEPGHPGCPPVKPPPVH
jgi:hypothetical protein